jgi:voltage-gated potassium channel
MDQPTRTPVTEPPPTAKHRPIRRATDRFLSDPSSGRNAIIVIVIADLAVVVVGGLTIWLLDPAEFEEPTTAFWYILQTITTVGYGDVTPAAPIGRFIGAIFMLLGIAFLTILTASITSAFIDARQATRRAENEAEDDARWARLEETLDGVIARLDRLERSGRERQDT